MAKLKKRGLVWYAWIPKREGGTRLVSTNCTDKEAAGIRAKELERIAVDPGYAAAASYTVRELVSDYVASRVRLKRSPATVSFVTQKGGHLARLLPTHAADVDHGASLKYWDARAKEGADLSTISKEFGVLRGAWRLARKSRLVMQEASEILPTIEVPDKARTRFLTPWELVALLSQLRDDHAARVAWIVATGARWGESNRAQREDIDFAKQLVHLRGSKTKKSLRKVTIIGLAASMLQWSLERAAGSLAMFSPWTNVRRGLHAACVRLGIPAVSPNDLRRTFSTWLTHAGVDLKLVAESLGHVDTRMVERHYGKMTPEAVRDLLQTRDVGPFRLLENGVELMSGGVGETGNPGQPETITAHGNSAETRWPGPESNWGHADFQSAGVPYGNSDNQANSETTCAANVGRLRVRDAWNARGPAFHEATANLYELLVVAS